MVIWGLKQMEDKEMPSKQLEQLEAEGVEGVRRVPGGVLA